MPPETPHRTRAAEVLEAPLETVRVRRRCLASRFAANWRAWHLTGSTSKNMPP